MSTSVLNSFTSIRSTFGNLYKKFASDPVLFGTVIVSAGSFLSSVLNYLLHIILGRLLSIADYGTFTSLLSVSLLIGIPALALTNSIIKVVAELKANNKYDVLTQLFIKISLFAFIIGSVVFYLLYSHRAFVAAYLNVDDLSLFVPAGFFLGIQFLNIAPSSYLQGLLRFKAFAFFAVTASILRVTLAVLFVLWGFGIGGAVLGIALSMVAAFFISIGLLKKNFTKSNKLSLRKQYIRIATFSVATFFIGVGLTLLNNMDVILVKHYFDGTSAGLYSGVVTVGKVFLFGAGTITLVMYPQISEIFTKGGAYLDKFRTFLYLQLLIVFGGILAFSTFPEFIVLHMFGDRFLAAVEYVPSFVIFIGLYILINFMLMFFLAINKAGAVLFLIPAVIAQFVFIYLYHGSLQEIIDVNIAVSGVLLIMLVVYSTYVSFSNRTSV